MPSGSGTVARLACPRQNTGADHSTRKVVAVAEIPSVRGATASVFHTGDPSAGRKKLKVEGTESAENLDTRKSVFFRMLSMRRSSGRLSTQLPMPLC